MLGKSLFVECPSCGHTPHTSAVAKTLAEGRKPVCEKCGSEIAIDEQVLENIRGVLRRLGLTDVPPGAPFQTRSSVSHRCPHCGAASSVAMDQSELGERERIFCANCGKEILIDRDEIQTAQHALAGQTAPTGGDETQTFNTPVGTIVVKKKTSHADAKVDTDRGKAAGPVAEGPAGESAGAAPIPAAPNVIEPRKGCFGVVAVLASLWVVVLIYVFLW